MKKKFLAMLTLAILLALSMAPAAWAATSGPEAVNVPINIQWSLTTIDDQTITNETFARKTQVIIFVNASLKDDGNAVCLNSSQTLNGIIQNDWLDNDDIQVIVIDGNNNSKDKVQAFVNKFAPDNDQIIFALNGNRLLWQMKSNITNLTDMYAFNFIIKDNQVCYAWNGSHQESYYTAALNALGFDLIPSRPEDTLVDSGSLSLAKLSQDEIKDLFSNAPIIDFSDSELYSTLPSYNAPYAAGALKEEPLTATLNRLNALRRLAGLPAVALDSELTEKAQYGAVITAHYGVLNHSPSQPSDMDKSFYDLAYEATSSSNLNAGSILTATPDGFMRDRRAKNIAQLGHRRWQLNPTMGKTGFGHVTHVPTDSGKDSSYTVEWSFDQTGSGCNYDYIAWPASGNFPNDLEYAWENTTAWSVTLNPAKYLTPSMNEVTVTLTRENDKKTWTFNGSGYTPSDNDDYYNIDTSNYGVNNCIIFRPSGIDAYEGVYNVKITGLKYADGSNATLSYQVNFFELAETTVAVTGVTLDKPTLNLNVNGTATLQATVAPNNAANKTVRWTTSNDKVATVDNNGNVKAVAAGSATITVTTEDGGRTAICTVNVTSSNTPTVPVTGVTLDKTTLNLNVNGTATLQATVAPNNAANKTVRWTTSNDKVATVDNNGNVKAVAAGSAKITATTEDGNKTATCTVTVNSSNTPTVPVTEVTLNQTRLNLAVSDNAALTATVEPNNATNKTVRWTTSNDKVATVDNTGNVKALAAGTATITATTEDGNKTATCTVNVTEKKVPVTSITLNKTALALDVRTSETLIVTVLPADATNTTVAWTSSNEKVATVDKDGKVTALTKGTATITATADGVKAECTVTVTTDKVYTITFDTDGGRLATGTTNPDYVTKGATYKIPTATKSGYTLKHWAIGAKDSATTAKANDAYTFTEDTTVYAVWQYNGGGSHSGGSHKPSGGTTTPTKPGETTKPGTTTEKPGTTTNKPSGTVTALNINNVFADVKNGEWYSEAVAYVYNKGMMNGTEKGFEPNAATTRAMLVTMLYRLEGEPNTGSANFSDVASGQWFSKAIAWANANGVVKGYENGTFGPNDAITREQLAAVLYRYAQAKGMDVSAKGDLSAFSDSAKVSGWATEAMQWAVGVGIIKGDNNNLRPQGNATRAEVAMMIMRFNENIAK